jgi:hypothetical protein
MDMTLLNGVSYVLASAEREVERAGNLARVAAMAIREARLRPEWAEFYPGIDTGVWHVAAQLVPLVLRQRIQGQAAWEFARRILIDEHFEFRGGRPRDESWTGILTRVEDA